MKCLKVIFLVFLPMIAVSCRVPKEILWDMMVMPFAGVNKEQVHNIDGFMPDCAHGQYELDTIYLDSLRWSENFHLSKSIYQTGKFSLIQTRMFDSIGNFAGGYEICLGNAQYLGIYDSLPIVSRFKELNDSLVNHRICFQNDVYLLDVSSDEREDLLNDTNLFDYTIVVFWPSSSRYYTKRHLKQVKDYVNRYGKYNRFRFLYVHIPSLK